MTEFVPNNIIATSGTKEVTAIEPLTDSERAEIDHEISHYPQKQAATIEALKIVQNHQRWVSDGKLKAIAEYLEVSAEDVESVATFYNKIYRQPVAETVISMCDSVSCWTLGYTQLIAHACNKLGVSPGQLSAKNKFTILPTPCLGACDKAPVMLVEETLIENVTVEKIDDILQGGLGQ